MRRVGSHRTHHSDDGRRGYSGHEGHFAETRGQPHAFVREKNRRSAAGKLVFCTAKQYYYTDPLYSPIATGKFPHQVQGFPRCQSAQAIRSRLRLLQAVPQF